MGLQVMGKEPEGHTKATHFQSLSRARGRWKHTPTPDGPRALGRKMMWACR